MADALLPVTQADRDAVQAFHRIQGQRLMRDILEGTDTLSAKGDDTDTLYQAFARHRIEATAARDAAIKRAIDWIRSAPLESGICCCGNPMEGHGYGEGHSPVDDLAYSAANLELELLEALA